LLAADGNKNAVVDAGDYVLWRKAVSPGAAAGESVASLSAAATTNDSAAAPSTVQGDMPKGISSGITSGITAPMATSQLPASATSGAIDIAMGAFRRANVASGTRRVLFRAKIAPALRIDETALLMALHKTMKGIDLPSSWLASDSHCSDDVNESSAADDLFAALNFKLGRL
jgi:hypothetical protein